MTKERKLMLKKLLETREWLLEGGDNIGLWLCKVSMALVENKPDKKVLEILTELD